MDDVDVELSPLKISDAGRLDEIHRASAASRQSFIKQKGHATEIVTKWGLNPVLASSSKMGAAYAIRSRGDPGRVHGWVGAFALNVLSGKRWSLAARLNALKLPTKNACAISVFLHVSARRSKKAAAALDKLKARLRDAGIRHIYALLHPKNSRAKILFDNAGFQQVKSPRVPKYYMMDGYARVWKLVEALIAMPMRRHWTRTLTLSHKHNASCQALGTPAPGRLRP